MIRAGKTEGFYAGVTNCEYLLAPGIAATLDLLAEAIHKSTLVYLVEGGRARWPRQVGFGVRRQNNQWGVIVEGYDWSYG